MFKGLGNLGNIASMVGALQELPQKIQELNEKMGNETVTATSDCEAVTVVLTCTGKMASVTIEKEEVGKEDLQLAIADATNQAAAAAKQRFAEAIREMAEEMNLNVPGIEGLISSMTGNG